MDITFVIITWNSADHLSNCLGSLFGSMHGTGFSYELRIVDNGSMDGTRKIISRCQEKHPDKVIPILLDHNTGTTRSRNLALRNAAGDFIVILDSDVEMRKGTVEKLIQVLRECPSCGIAAPRLEYPNGSLQRSTDHFPTLLSKVFRFFFLKHQEHRENWFKDGTVSAGIREVDYAISAFWVLGRKTLDAVGLMDENIFYAPEDADFCLRTWKSGLRVLYVPQVGAVHHAREISRGINQATFRHLSGLIYYFRKHRYFLIRPRVAATKA